METAETLSEMTAAELSEAAASLSILNRTNGTGASNSGWCPRMGSMLLRSPHGAFVVVKTTCKTWGCKGCRDRVMNLFKLRVTTGCSTLGRCAFITLTYKLEDVRKQDVGYVARDWKALWRQLRKEPWTRNLEWLRVMELTKKGMPHHHLVMGKIPGGVEINCWQPGAFKEPAYADVWETCLCLSHRLSRVWWEVTKDSYIVHTVPVITAYGAGGYMAKYMSKQFDEKRAATLGMERRWSTSRGWPGNGHLRLKQLEWHSTLFRPGYVPPEVLGQYNMYGEKSELNYLMERTGAPVMIEQAERRSKRASLRKIEGLLDVQDVSAAPDADRVRSGDRQGLIRDDPAVRQRAP